MAKESSEGEFLKKKKSVDHNRKWIENLSKANTDKKKVMHLDQLEFLPIFLYSEVLIWMQPAPNVTDQSYFNSVCLKIFTALFLLAKLKTFVFYQCIVDLSFFFFFFFFFLC